jgi:hypothetical protein
MGLVGLGDERSWLGLDVLVPARDRDRDSETDEDDGQDGDEDEGGGGGHHGGRHAHAPVPAHPGDRGDEDEGGGDGAIQLLVSSDSRSLDRVSLGRVRLSRARPGIYFTARFEIPAEVRSKLAGDSFDDLVFTIRLHRPEKAHGTWAFDNLRVRSPGTPPPDSGRSADLLAILTYAPASSTPGEASFPVGLVQVPRDLHLKHGRAGHGSARLELGFGSSFFATCHYRARHDGTGYRIRGCRGGPRSGDLVAADHARLTLLDGDPGAGTTKLLAQLAVNPAGDAAGPGILPPMPTFWGATPAEASAIVTRYFDLINGGGPRTEERWFSTPVPDFALRHGDGSPHDNLTGPPPPNDPPFDQEGHLNQGGNWDGYWRLAGNLNADNTANRAKTHLDATFSTHGVAWGHDVEVASVQTTIDTDYGQLDNGLQGSSANGSLHMYIFGSEIPGGGPFTSGVDFVINAGDTATLDLPSVDIWIFSITMGINAAVSVKGSGGISPAGLALQVTPKASVGVHLEGGVSVVVASGSVSADIDLLSVDTPFHAMAGWIVDTNPGVCAASLAFNLDGDLHLTSLGGKVDLKATFGICPFCDHESWTVFQWTGVDLGTVALFHVSGGTQVFPLPGSLCASPLVAFIDYPPAATAFVAGLPYALHGHATPMPTAANPYPTPLDCSALLWSSDDGADGWSTQGCEPVVAFDTARLGARTVSLHAADGLGDTGNTAVAVTIVPPAAGLHAYIVQPSPYFLGVDDVDKSLTVPFHLVGAATGASPAATFAWTSKVVDPPGSPVPIGTGSEIDWAPGVLPGFPTVFDVTLTVTDGATSASDTVTVAYFVIF